MSLLNSGLGPAQILRITICVAGLEIRGDTHKGWNLAIRELGLSEFKPNVEVISGGFIQSGERTWLFSWPHTPELRGVEQLHTVLPSLYVGVTYASMYGEQAEATYGTCNVA